MQDLPQTPDGWVPLLDWFYAHYGPGWTLSLIMAVPVAFLVVQMWQMLRKGKAVDIALATKEDSIQRLAEENRMYRAVLFKEKFGWSDQQIESFMNRPALEAKKGKKK
jgi:hypothetical protein